MFDRGEVYGPMQVNFLSAPAENPPKNVIPIFMKVLHLLSSALSSLVGLSEETGHSSVWTLQKFDWQLERCTSWTHGPVS